MIHKQDAVYPGQPWLDTNGKRIQAHGGAVYYESGVYYWYGENKEKTDGKSGIWTWGIRVYASKDLCNWEDLGLIIEPDTDDEKSSLYPTKKLDRPHIIKNEKTGKYVCWIKLSGAEACFVVLSADALTGPYRIEKNEYRPYGYKIGDFDLVIEEETKKAYLYMDVCHDTISCLKLTDDYLSVEQEICKSYEKMEYPFCREAPAVFERKGKKYMLTSGVSGYAPNKSEIAVSDSWEGPFQSMGNPHEGDKSGASFNSQISKVFRVRGKEDLYIAMADRWIPECPIDARLTELIKRGIGAHINPEKFLLTEEEKKEFESLPLLGTVNTSIADYVWLPIGFKNGKVSIKWKEKWSIDDYK